jgi:hypothetical protein
MSVSGPARTPNSSTKSPSTCTGRCRPSAPRACPLSLKGGHVKIAGSMYHLNGGRVEFLWVTRTSTRMARVCLCPVTDSETRMHTAIVLGIGCGPRPVRRLGTCSEAPRVPQGCPVLSAAVLPSAGLNKLIGMKSAGYARPRSSGAAGRVAPRQAPPCSPGELHGLAGTASRPGVELGGGRRGSTDNTPRWSPGQG